MRKKSLSLLTYNIHKGFGVGKIRFLLPEMKSAIQRLNPELVFLQEVQGRHDKQEKKLSDWPKEAQFEYIAEKLWPHFAYGKNAIYESGHHGNAILSKYNFLEYENINVSEWIRASRSLLHATIKLSDQEVHLLCVHLGFFKEERLKQMAALSARIMEYIPQDAPLIIGGDFNDWRKELFEELEDRLGLKEAIKEVGGEHAKSFPAMSPALHVDRIYFRGLKLKEAECLKGKPWRGLSDHLPLFAKFTL